MKTTYLAISVAFLLFVAFVACDAGAQTAGSSTQDQTGPAQLHGLAGGFQDALYSADNDSGPIYTLVRYCGRYWVEGHYNRRGHWVPPHWRYRHWVEGHYNRYGRWIPGRCA